MALKGRTKGTTRASKEIDTTEIITQMMVLMGKMADQQAESLKMQQEWLKLFKPPEGPIKSTTFEEREQLKNNNSLWTEVDAQQMIKEMQQELGFLATSDDDGVM